MKTLHTILLTYDLLQRLEVDLGVDTIRALYSTGCLEESFVIWQPERLAMQVKFADGNSSACMAAIQTALRALYITRPKARVKNLRIWLDETEMPAPDAQPAQQQQHTSTSQQTLTLAPA